MSLLNEFPPELLFNVAAAIFYAARPATPFSLDPPVQYDDNFPPPTALPSTVPPPIWPEPLARKTLASLCLVSKSFYSAAKPWLWRRIEVRLPQTWLSLIDTVVDPSALMEQMDLDGDNIPGNVTQTIDQVASKAIAMARPSLHSAHLPSPDPNALRESVIATLSAPPDASIPPELLTPPSSREPSPRRLQLRAKSPGRWRFLRDISTALQAAMSQNVPGIYLPTVDDPHPARHIQHLDFNHFRTIGMRRVVGEGVNNRFVTSDRLYRILQEMPNLLSFGATEYMDGALDQKVLIELLFRGRNIKIPSVVQLAAKPGSAFTDLEIEEDNWARRRECVALEALDLCGCVSAVFVAALSEVLEKYVDGSKQVQETRRGRGGNAASASITFPYMRRLGLRGAKSITPNALETFVLAFPNLTHLDISGTRCSPELLDAIGASDSLRLRALSLGRCPALTGLSIERLLVRGRSTRYLKQLSLYGDATFPNPLSESEISNIVSKAPCFLSGTMVYLDLSSSKLTESALKIFPSQPSLRSLGLSYISTLPLKEISTFIRDKCSNLEILTLINSTTELIGPARSISLSLHQAMISPLTKPPFSFSISGTAPKLPPPTRLRVIELSNASLNGLGEGSEGWRIVRSKGGRGWYVDSTTVWSATDARGAVLERDVGLEHPYRKEIDRLANACGNVSSGVGWHARKMEILNGDGLLGREDGLYGAVSFAYNS